ncbi:MAG TPA: TraR/DksA C4-type zinc finger protein [Gaiellaceae bacterium]
MDEARASELLATERARIERQLRELGPLPDDELAHADQHLAEEATELYEDEYEAGLIERLRNELEAVERAEARLADGTYGLSIESGAPIPDERLELVPTAERTAEEQDRYERGR